MGPCGPAAGAESDSTGGFDNPPGVWVIEEENGSGETVSVEETTPPRIADARHKKSILFMEGNHTDSGQTGRDQWERGKAGRGIGEWGYIPPKIRPKEATYPRLVVWFLSVGWDKRSVGPPGHLVPSGHLEWWAAAPLVPPYGSHPLAAGRNLRRCVSLQEPEAFPAGQASCFLLAMLGEPK